MTVKKFTASKLGEITTNFLLNDHDVYIQNTSATGGYLSTDWTLIGYTSAEKTFNPITEKYNREDKIPRVPTYTKTIRKGLEITSGLSNRNEELLGVIMQGTEIDLGTGTGTKISHGISEPALQYRAIMFSSVRDDSVTYNVVIPKCELSLAGEQTMGGETEMVSEIMFKAVHNPSANATGSLFYEEYLASGVNATANVPPAYT